MAAGSAAAPLVGSVQPMGSDPGIPPSLRRRAYTRAASGRRRGTVGRSPKEQRSFRSRGVPTAAATIRLDMAGRYRPMSFAIETERLRLRLRGPQDAVWNLELLGEHEGGTTLTLADAERRLAQQAVQAHASGIGLLAMQRRAEGDVIGYCGLLIGRGSFDEPELAYELLRRAHGHGYATEAASGGQQAWLYPRNRAVSARRSGSGVRPS